MTVVNANVRAAETCSIHVSTKKIPPLLGLGMQEEAKSGRTVTWDDNDGADHFTVDVFELSQGQSSFVAALDTSDLRLVDLTGYKRATTFTESNGDATSVDLGSGLISGIPYLIRITPVAGGKQGDSDLIPVTLRKWKSITNTSISKVIFKECD